jgi:hypothetical protein
MYHSCMKKILFQCSGVLLGVHLIIFWLLNYSPLEIPQYFTLFEDKKINLHGLIILLAVGLILRFFLQRHFRENPESSLAELTSIGVLAELCAEAIFQLVRQFTFSDSSGMAHVVAYFISVMGGSFIAGILSVAIAGRLKKKRGVPYVTTLLLVVLYFIYQYMVSSRLL